jgi:hypothetical protein
MGDYGQLPAITGHYRQLAAITGVTSDYRWLPALTTGDYRR